MSPPLPAFPEPLVLASASPRRRALLTEFGYRFETVVAKIEEVVPAHLTVAETTLFNAKIKAEAVARHCPAALVLAADTLVALDGAALGKPADLAEACRMLTRLSGRTHEVFSGVWLKKAHYTRGFIVVSRVRFRPLSAAEIDAYLASIQPLDKAGAYAAQDDAQHIIAEITGSRTNVIGLPMEKLAEVLAEF